MGGRAPPPRIPKLLLLILIYRLSLLLVDMWYVRGLWSIWVIDPSTRGSQEHALVQEGIARIARSNHNSCKFDSIGARRAYIGHGPRNLPAPSAPNVLPITIFGYNPILIHSYTTIGQCVPLDSISINRYFSVIESSRSHLYQDFAVLQRRNKFCGQHSIMAQWNPVRRGLLHHDRTRLLW
jgi:hypothetical protein